MSIMIENQRTPVDDETLTLRQIVDCSPALLHTARPDGYLDFFNQTWLDFSGEPLEKLLGWGWTSCIHPEDVESFAQRMRESFAKGVAFQETSRVRRADGQYRWMLHQKVPLRDSEGKIVKWHGSSIDIEDQRRSEDELRRSAQRLQRSEHELLGIIDTIPSMLWAASPSGEVTQISQSVREYSGLSLKDFLNLGWKRFIHPDDVEDTAKTFFQAIQTGASYSVIHRLRRRDGEYRWHHARGEPLRDPEGKIIQWYGLSIDIDEQKRAEDHLRETHIKLTRASRIATVAELSASIAHELNQPLMSIFASAQAAKRWLAASSPNIKEVNTSIERILRDARAADETMQHIRALFKREPFVKKEVDIPDMLMEAIRFVQEDPKKREVAIEWQIDEPLPSISVDRTQVQQVFINLLSNAIEALEGNQAVPVVRLTAKKDRDEIIVQVIDNGPGVVDAERIFDAFVTTKDKGMGIGLAVSRSIIEAHGGRLWAENSPDGGARFNVALPLDPVNKNPTEDPGYRA